jgi:hypothetical protein
VTHSAELTCIKHPSDHDRVFHGGDAGTSQTHQRWRGRKPEDAMADDQSKQDKRDRSRINASEPYEVEYFHRKHPHLTREQAEEIIRDEGGNRERADAAAERLKGR